MSTSTATTTAPSGPAKKRKRSSPFRIKIGCVVALRYKPSTGNHVTMIVPPSPGSPENTKPTKHPLHCLVGTDSHVEVWTEPIPGRDEGLALIGRRVRCCFTREVKSNGETSNGVADNGKQQSKKTKKIIVEGEVVSILCYGTSKWIKQQETGRRQRRTAACGTDVELLIDRDVLEKAPFLDRTDEDVNVDNMKKESAKRAHKNEEAIKGKNKVIVRVNLVDASGIVADTGSTSCGEENTAKWAIRKRIPNEPGQPLVEPLQNGSLLGGSATSKKQINGTSGDGKAPGSVGKEGKKTNGSKKAPTSPTQFMGNKNDDAAEQQRNWRWFSARFDDIYLTETDDVAEPATLVCNRNTIPFLEYYSDILAACGGFVGEVLEVTPSSRAGTLAMVTVRRLILPEHTASGAPFSVYRQRQGQGGLEVFDDYDSTLIGRKKKADGNEDEDAEILQDAKKENGPSSVVFRMPIEELVIVSRQLKRNFQNQSQEQDLSTQVNMDELKIEYSYSWKADSLVSLKSMVPKKLVDGDSPSPHPLTKKKLKKLSLCHRCRRWLPKKQVATCDNMNCTASRYLSCSTADGEDKPVSLDWCKRCMGAMRGIESIIDQDISADTSQALGDLPCCLSLCDCRRCHLVDQRKTNDDLVSALENAHNNSGNRGLSDDKAKSDPEFDNSPFQDAEETLKLMPACHFDIPAKYVELKSLPLSGSKLITKNTKPPVKKGTKANSTAAKPTLDKRKRDTPPSKKSAKKQKLNNARPRTPPPPSPKPQRAARRTSEDYSVFKPSCSRLLDCDTIAAAKAKRNASDEERLLLGQLVSGDKPRNLREVYEKKARLDAGKKVQKDVKILSGRAARANQRRLVKDVARLGASSLNLDTLAGRESQLRFDRSGIHGWGVFADVEISAGDMIIEYRGVNIGNAMAEKREREYELAKIGSDYMFRIDGLTVCDATKQGNVARFLNASCDPNCYTKIITLDGKQRIVIYAKKDIKVGEELCYDYKFEMEDDEAKRIPCCCNSPDCKGFMNWDKKRG